MKDQSIKIIFKSRKCPLFWFGAAAVTIGNKIYIRDDWKKYQGSKFFEVLIRHEKVHALQQRIHDNFFINYALDKKFRLRMEIPAYFEQYLAGIYTAEKIAGILSGKTYFNMIDYEGALAAFQQYTEIRGVYK